MNQSINQSINQSTSQSVSNQQMSSVPLCINEHSVNKVLLLLLLFNRDIASWKTMTSSTQNEDQKKKTSQRMQASMRVSLQSMISVEKEELFPKCGY